MRMSALHTRVLSVLGFALRRINRPDLNVRKSPATWIAAAAAVVFAYPAVSALQDNTTAADVSADQGNSRSIAVGDVDGDGSPDIVIANEDGERNRIYYGDGTGGFAAGVDIDNTEEDSDSVDLADVTSDGLLDIVIGNRGASEPNRIYVNQGGRVFTFTNTSVNDPVKTRATSTVRFADLDTDGEPDLMVANRNSGNRIFYGNASPGLPGFPSDDVLPGSGASDSSSMAAGNLTVDACPDVVVANRRNVRNDLYVNSANCSSYNIRRDLSPDANYTDWIEIADINNDGINDVLLANRYQQNLYLLGTGSADLNALFEPSKAIGTEEDYTRDIRAVDLDGDGDLDIVTANNAQSTNKIYLNQLTETGALGFSEGIPLTSEMTESIAIAVCGPVNNCDLDGDSDVDIAFANNGTAGEGAVNRVYFNNNEDPAFTSTPVTGATDGDLYSYNITAFDPDQGQTLTISAGNPLPAWLGLTDNGDGTALLEGTPGAADVGGTHVVVLQVSDGTLADGQNFNIAVSGSNAAPTITSTAPTSVTQGTGGAAYSYDITTDDADDAGSALTLSAETLPGWLTLTDAGDGTGDLTGTPSQGDIGEVDITLRVTDAGGRIDEEAFTITVADGNDAPDAQQDSIQMVLGGTVSQLGPGEPEYNATTVLWNDVDADGDTLTATGISILPANGTVTNTAGTPGTIDPDGSFIYTHDGSPADGNNELDRFRYRISDGNGGTDQASVIIFFSGGNTNPEAADDSYTVPNGGSIAAGPNVLANDSDANGDNLTAQIVTEPANAAAGTFMLNADGTFTYTHDGSATTTDSFTYVAIDDSPAMGQSNTATVTLTIEAPLDTTPPVITLLGSASVNVTVGNAYTDAGATATDDMDGDLTGSIVVDNPVNTAVVGTYTVRFNVSDAAGNAATEVTRTVVVSAAAPPPPPPPPTGGGGASALLELLGLMFLVVMSRRRQWQLTRRSF